MSQHSWASHCPGCLPARLQRTPASLCPGPARIQPRRPPCGSWRHSPLLQWASRHLPLKAIGWAQACPLTPHRSSPLYPPPRPAGAPPSFLTWTCPAGPAWLQPTHLPPAHLPVGFPREPAGPARSVPSNPGGSHEPAHWSRALRRRPLQTGWGRQCLPLLASGSTAAVTADPVVDPLWCLVPSQAHNASNSLSHAHILNH